MSSEHKIRSKHLKYACPPARRDLMSNGYSPPLQRRGNHMGGYLCQWGQLLNFYSALLAQKEPKGYSRRTEQQAKYYQRCYMVKFWPWQRIIP